MKQIIITKEQFIKTAQMAMREYTDKMRKSNDGKYNKVDELSDVLTLAVAFAFLEKNLFGEGGESDESNEQ